MVTQKTSIENGVSTIKVYNKGRLNDEKLRLAEFLLLFILCTAPSSGKLSSYITKTIQNGVDQLDLKAVDF